MAPLAGRRPTAPRGDLVLGFPPGSGAVSVPAGSGCLCQPSSQLSTARWNPHASCSSSWGQTLLPTARARKHHARVMHNPGWARGEGTQAGTPLMPPCPQHRGGGQLDPQHSPGSLPWA